jgi:uncharacterized membrane protein
VSGIKIGTSDGVQSTTTDSKGRFYFSLPEGRYQIYSQDLRYDGSPMEIETRSDQSQNLTMSVNPTKPTAWYRVQLRLRNLLR